MGLKDELKPTGRSGIFYKEHPARKHGIRKDRLLYLRFTVKGKAHNEIFGWESEGKSIPEAELKIIEFRKNARSGSGPTCMKDERAEEEREEAARLLKERREITVEKMIGEYIERYAKRKKKSWKEDQRALNKDLECWFTWKAKDVTRQDAADLLEAVSQRAGIQANNLLEKARRMFNVAMQWGYVEANPFAMQVKPTPSKVRNRSLTDEEIRSVWLALESGSGVDGVSLIMGEDLRRAFRLMLLTGQRPGEVAGMHRREIEGHWWTIPSERIKAPETKKQAGTVKPHRVYLTDKALELIGKRKGYIFASNSKRGHISTNALAVALRRNIQGASSVSLKTRKKKPMTEPQPPANRIGIDFFRPHDLRRTVVTGMARIGIIWETRERVVNHAVGILEHTYNQHDYDKEKQIALQKWGAHLEQVIEGSSGKVINFPVK